MSELKLPCPFCGMALGEQPTYWEHPYNEACILSGLRYSDLTAWNRRSSPWVSMETPPTDHHPAYLVKGHDGIDHKAYWDGDRWIYEGAGFEANAFAYYFAIPPLEDTP